MALKKNLFFTLILILTYTSSFPDHHQISATQYPIPIWPIPTLYQWTHPHAIPISPNFKISTPPNHRHRYLTRAIHRYNRQILTENHKPLTPPSLNLTTKSHLRYLTVTVTNLKTPLTHAVNESYTLSIPCNGKPAVINSVTAWGAMHGLETFSQMVYGKKAVCGVYISDEPRFMHRGVMLDTSRNYFGVKDLKRLIRGLGMNKMNVLHLHLTDSHSFPIVIETEMEMARKGAYGEDMVYRVEDVECLVEYGFEFGVRVVPEIDMPGHTRSWGSAYPEIVTCADKFWYPAEATWEDRFAAEPGPGQLNPLNPKTYQVVKNVIHDVISMFPDTFFHAGADEIIPNCWKVDPLIKKFLSNNGTLSQVLEKFINSTLPYILSHNRTVVYWEDVLLDAEVNVSSSLLPRENVILQSWNNGPSNIKRIVNAGYRAIVSSSEFYYLDCGHGDFLGNDSQYDQPPSADQGDGGSWCGPFKTWQMIYNYDITYGLSEAESKMVLGGEVALWSEQADSTVMDSRIWPRASAMAEALWSGNRDETGKKRSAEATDRLNEWRYRMVSRGIGAEPIQPLWCVRNPGMCNTVHPF